jgi:hypothetical protein
VSQRPARKLDVGGFQERSCYATKARKSFDLLPAK